MLVARTQTFDQRAAILGRLLWRNRLVSVLRLAVPALGVAAFLVLMGQMWLTSLARLYGLSGIPIDRGLAGASVLHPVDRVPILRQGGLQGLADHRVVFDEQDSHEG